MKGAPRSAQFDDIYFSADDGLEETNYVFLQGNNLPERWQSCRNFTIAETGFGTGLNFLCAWKLFDETAAAGQTLDFISVEKFPMTAEDIRAALMPWQDYFGDRLEKMLAQYPLRIAGWHRIKLTPQITLTLIFDDVNAALPRVQASVDCWFLDGFTPAKNPEMWSETVFQNMARLSAQGASFASFTAAGDVRRGLSAAGFSVSKKKGFGHKRDMIAGTYEGNVKAPPKFLPRGARVAIIGGGLAGTSCAYVLKQYGFNSVIYEQEDTLASAASGNAVGLYNPRFSKLRDSLSDFFAPAYAHLIRMAQQAGEAIEYRPCGSLHLMNGSDKVERMRSMAAHWGWYEDHARLVLPQEASALAGIDIESEALWLPDSGTVSPQKLCAYYAQDIEVHLNHCVDDISLLDADAVILAGGAGLKNFAPVSWIPAELVRGQVSFVQETAQSKNLKCNLCFGGYLSPSRDGAHTAGSSFEKNTTELNVRDEEHAHNIGLVQENVPALATEEFIVTEGRAGMRVATNDRFPVVGAVPNEQNLYISSAFGSHGLVGSLAGAHLLADMLRGGAFSLPNQTVNALSPHRFIARAAKKGRVLV